MRTYADIKEHVSVFRPVGKFGSAEDLRNVRLCPSRLLHWQQVSLSLGEDLESVCETKDVYVW